MSERENNWLSGSELSLSGPVGICSVERSPLAIHEELVRAA